MNGDGMNGLALAIFIAILFLGLAPPLVLGLIGRRLFKTPGLIAGVVIGFIAGPLIAIATFFESTWSPPVALTFTGVAHRSVALVSDPAAAPIVITGPNLPFVTRRVSLEAPKTGVVHVRDLTPLRTEVVEAFFADKRATGMIANGDMIAFDFGDPEFDKIDPAKREAPPAYPADKVQWNNRNDCARLVYKRGCAETRTGTIVTRVTIDNGGQWLNTEIISNSIKRDPALVEQCLRDQLKTWTYLPPGEAPTTFELTFHFGDKC